MTVPGGSGLAAEPSVDMPADVVGLEEPESVDPTTIAGPCETGRAGVHALALRGGPATSQRPEAAGLGRRWPSHPVLVLVAASGRDLQPGRPVDQDRRPAFYQQQVDLNQRMNNILKDVKDVPSAKAASGPLNQVLREHKEFDEKIRNKKANKKDIEAAEAEFGPKKEALQKQFIEEMIRVAVIPGASEALDLKSMPGADERRRRMQPTSPLTTSPPRRIESG